jgi:hypothetical protein
MPRTIEAAPANTACTPRVRSSQSLRIAMPVARKRTPKKTDISPKGIL